jgi:hypothetical protein
MATEKRAIVVGPRIVELKAIYRDTRTGELYRPHRVRALLFPPREPKK